MLLHDVAAALHESRVPFAIVGGYAVALHGAVRGTIDLDIVLRFSRPHFIAAEIALKKLGLASRLPVTAAEVFEFREEYIKNRNLAAWSFIDAKDPTRIVDVVITHDLSTMKVERIRVGDQSLPVLAVPDLIAMKRASGRPQDREDIKALEALRK